VALQFKNTLTGKKEEFVPMEPGKVRMYACGPTVYNYPHIGNYRTFTFVDLLRRYLKFKGLDVYEVMNVTDIDDKIILNAIKNGVSREEYAAPFVKAFFNDQNTLGIEPAELYPKATDHIDEMVKLVQALADKGLAYEVDGNYYFKISAWPEYGKLSRLDLDSLKAGARVATDEYDKESVSDFALWKAWDEKDGDIFWETPLGKGRPGWHLECSAMSNKYLGETFDIHCGGEDLIFPHHENEIAQSEGATGKQFVRYWLHSRHLIVEGRKMSKSLGNYFTLPEVVERGYSGKAIRFVLLSTHYGQQLNFTFEGLDAAAHSLERYNDFISNLDSYPGGESDGSASTVIDKAAAGFEENLDDDLNISGALAVVFDFIRDVNRLRADNKLSASERDAALELIRRFDTVLGFEIESGSLDKQVEDLIERRTAARESKDFAEADRIRDQLAEMGIVLEDTPQGVKWKKKV
jgi:cysteinyl-tRNA synthetase